MTAGEAELLLSPLQRCQYFLATSPPHPREKNHPIQPTQQDCVSKLGDTTGTHHKRIKWHLLINYAAGIYSTMVVSYLLVSDAVDRVVLGLLGMVVSLYSLRVEVMKERYPNYRAACDFSDRFSCSKALCSPYGKGFGFVGLLVGKDHFLNQRNCTLGIVFYAVQLALGLLPVSTLCSSVLFYSSVLASIGCVYLAFILFVVLRDICVVCIATYFINSALIYLNYSLYYNNDMPQ